MSARIGNGAIDSWKILMRELPEPVFMEIMNNYLGGVTTPYNKPDLLNALAGRLTRPENMERQIGMISREDRLLLAAVLWFGDGDLPFLKDFFSSRFSPLELEERVRGLEERLLIFGPGGKLVCTPLLPEDYLKQLHPGILYDLHPSLPPESGSLPLLNGSFLICFLSLIHGEKQIGNSDGSLKRRFLQRLEQVFPVSQLPGGESETLHMILDILKGLRLLSEQNGKWSLRQGPLKAFSDLDRRSQLLMLWGQLISPDRGSPDRGIRMMELLLLHMPASRGIETEDMKILIRILGDRVYDGPPALLPELMLKRLEAFHILLCREECWYLHPMIPRLTVYPSPPAAGSVFLHATFDVNLTPDSPFSSALALCLRTERYDAFAQLKLTDKSFAGFLRSGQALSDFIRETEQRFALALTQNVRFTLEDWEKEYNSCRLWDGLVLELDAGHRQVLEENPVLAPYVIRTLAPGILLMERESRAEWELLLDQLGVRSIPHVRRSARRKEYGLTPLGAPGNQLFTGLSEEEAPLGNREADEAHFTPLLSALDRLKDLNPDDREELEDRIRRGVIFMDDQLRDGMIRPVLRRAKGLDYQGKLRMIQSVLGDRSWQLDISLPEGDFDIRTSRIIPLRLEDKTEEAVLVGTELPDRPFQCPVRKISQIRKVRVSLF